MDRAPGYVDGVDLDGVRGLKLLDWCENESDNRSAVSVPIIFLQREDFWFWKDRDFVVFDGVVEDPENAVQAGRE